MSVCVYANIYKHTHTHDARKRLFMYLCIVIKSMYIMYIYLSIYIHYTPIHIYGLLIFSHAPPHTPTSTIHYLCVRTLRVYALLLFTFCCYSRFNIIILQRCIIHLLYSQYIPYIVRYIYDEKERCINMRLFRLYL